MLSSLKTGDLNAYFAGVSASGRSSFCYLQNVYTTVNVKEQGLSLALCLCDSLPTAAHRVHGGGFAGTVQAYVALDRVDEFRTAMDAVFGKDACRVLHIRTVGATCLNT
jgi:galactokinase